MHNNYCSSSAREIGLEWIIVEWELEFTQMNCSCANSQPLATRRKLDLSYTCGRVLEVKTPTVFTLYISVIHMHWMDGGKTDSLRVTNVHHTLCMSVKNCLNAAAAYQVTQAWDGLVSSVSHLTEYPHTSTRESPYCHGNGCCTHAQVAVKLPSITAIYGWTWQQKQQAGRVACHNNALIEHKLLRYFNRILLTKYRQKCAVENVKCHF